ncbi:MAG: dTDP-4-dehydrorhamnose reductase [Desulfovermiculus sp.]|nr:dTDP-4-dehydrorhamnose reductase [Desulfovermiculus sp.]
MHTVLITGVKGQLGRELARLLPDETCFPSGRDALDITDEGQVLGYCRAIRPGAIVNCAAYTAVDTAESDVQTAYAVNEKGPENLARAARELDIPLIHISTDFVFDGTKPGMYSEDDIPNPLSVYGHSKLAGEQVVFRVYPQTMVIRTGWLYSGQGRNFFRTILKTAGQRDELRVVADQAGTPTYARDLAQAIGLILSRCALGRGQIFHYAQAGIASWYDFAWAIVRLAGLSCRVVPIETREYPTPARRPQYSVLNTKKIRRTFDLHIDHWQDALRRCMQENTMTEDLWTEDR